MRYISHTGCQWRFFPDSFGPSARPGRSSAVRRATAPGRERSRCCTRPRARRAGGRAEARPEGQDDAVGHVLVSTPEEAEAAQFRGSPTVLVDGRDPFSDPEAPVGLAIRSS